MLTTEITLYLINTFLREKEMFVFSMDRVIAKRLPEKYINVSKNTL